MALTTINSGGVKDDSIVNADIKSDAAIAGSKVAPDFGSQDITSSGKINIGSSTHTTRKLAIHDTTNAAIVIEGASDGSSSILLADENDEDVGSIAYNHSTEDLTLTAADNIILTGDAVGIGTTNPAYPLDVVGDSGISVSPSTNSTVGQLSIVGKNSAGGVSAISRLKSNPDGSSSQSHLSIETRDSSAVMKEAIRITSDQKVGIGTSLPGRLLEVNSDTANTFIRIKSSDTGNAGLEFGDQSDSVQGAMYFNSDNNYLIINGYNNSGALWIDPTKNVHVVDGDLKIATGGHGIDFSAQTTSGAGNVTAATSEGDELFNHYERGVWQPNDQSGAGLTFSLQTASYFKIGGLVYVNAYFFYPTNSDSSDAQVGGLPFNNKANNYAFFSGRANGVTTSLNAQTASGTNKCALYTANTQLSNADLSGKYVLFSGCYPNV